MTKTEIKNMLRQSVDGKLFMTKNDLKKALGCGSDRAAEILNGVGYIRFSRKKYYSIIDIADELIKYSEV